jgi:hypothetical protein
MTKANANARHLYRNYRRSAMRRGIEWQLDEKEFFRLTEEPCYLCGAAPAARHVQDRRPSRGPAYIYNGIDRVRNDAGYVNGNVATCCGVCNMMKGTMDIETFLNHIAKIVGYQIDEEQADD